MAQRTITVLTDDITGEDIPEGTGETITFAVNGVEYSLDVADKQARKFHDTMQFYIDHGTKVGGRARRGSGGSSKKSNDTAKIKAWADEQGIDYPQRGRLPGSLIEQYEAANG